MAGKVKDLLVKILVDDSDVDKFSKAGSSALSMSSVMDKASVASAAVLGGLAAGAVVAGNAAAEAEQSTLDLQYALDQFPATADTNAEKLMMLNSALALKTKFDDDAIASGQGILAQFGLTGAQLEELTPKMLDYAAKTGQDVPAAAEALGKGLMGQGRALKAIGIDFTDTGSLAGNYDAILGGLTTQVGGFAEAQGETAQGSMAIFQNALGEIQENLGVAFLPLMTEASQKLAEFATWAADNTELIGFLAGGIGALATGVLVINGAMKAFAIVQAIQTAAQTANNLAWLASPTTWIILAIIVAIGLLVAAGIWLVQNWDGVVVWFGEAWTNISNIWGGFAGWWGDMWTGAGQVFKDVWGGIVSFVEDWVVNPILYAVEFMVNGVIMMINSMIDGINAVAGWTGLSIGRFDMVSIPKLAEGGIVTSPTLALIGEAGPEAVIPLSQGAGYGVGRGGATYHETVVKLDGKTIWRGQRRLDERGDY